MSLTRSRLIFGVLAGSAILGLVLVWLSRPSLSDLLFNFGLIAFGISASLLFVNLLIEEVVEQGIRRRDVRRALREVGKLRAHLANLDLRLKRHAGVDGQWCADIREFVTEQTGSRWAERGASLEGGVAHLPEKRERELLKLWSGARWSIEEAGRILPVDLALEHATRSAIEGHLATASAHLGEIQVGLEAAS